MVDLEFSSIVLLFNEAKNSDDGSAESICGEVVVTELYLISSTPKFQPRVKYTLTVVEPLAQPVATNCTEPVEIV